MPTRCDAYILCSNDSLLQSQVDNLSHHHHRAVPHRSQNLSHVHPVDEEICSPIEFAMESGASHCICRTATQTGQRSRDGGVSDTSMARRRV